MIYYVIILFYKLIPILLFRPLTSSATHSAPVKWRLFSSSSTFPKRPPKLLPVEVRTDRIHLSIIAYRFSDLLEFARRLTEAEQGTSNSNNASAGGSAQSGAGSSAEEDNEDVSSKRIHFSTVEKLRCVWIYKVVPKSNVNFFIADFQKSLLFIRFRASITCILQNI